MLGIALSVLIAGEAAARDLKTTTGEVFLNFAVTHQGPTGLRIQHDAGVAFVDFILLAEAEKKEFGFDAAAYAAAHAEKRAAEKLRLQAMAAHQAAVLAARKAAAQADASRGVATRSPSDRQAAQSVSEPQGVQATVDTPAFSTQTYDSDSIIILDGTHPAAVDSLRRYNRPVRGLHRAGDHSAQVKRDEHEASTIRSGQLSLSHPAP